MPKNQKSIIHKIVGIMFSLIFFLSLISFIYCNPEYEVDGPNDYQVDEIFTEGAAYAYHYYLENNMNIVIQFNTHNIDHELEFFICEEEDIDECISGTEEGRYNSEPNQSEMDMIFTIPFSGRWCFAFLNHQSTTFTASLYMDSNGGEMSEDDTYSGDYTGDDDVMDDVMDDVGESQSFMSIYPSPFGIFVGIGVVVFVFVIIIKNNHQNHSYSSSTSMMEKENISYRRVTEISNSGLCPSCLKSVLSHESFCGHCGQKL